MTFAELQRKPQGVEFARRSKNRLGDKIARIAQPIARVIDKVSGTKIAGCGGCKKMKNRLNAGMPIVEALKKRIMESRTKSTKAHNGHNEKEKT